MDFPAEIPAAGTVAAVIIFDPPIVGVPVKFGEASGAFVPTVVVKLVTFVFVVVKSVVVAFAANKVSASVFV